MTRFAGPLILCMLLLQAALVFLTPAASQVATPTFTPNYGSANFLANGLTNTSKTIKAARGRLGWISCYNPNSTAAYLQFYDLATAPNVGTTVPTLAIGMAQASAFTLPFPIGANFLNAIKVAATTTATGSTALATAVDCSFGFN